MDLVVAVNRLKTLLVWDEHHHQRAVVEWAVRMSGLVPELNLLYAIPNGGNRHLVTARRLKREGVRAGVPDLCLPVARGGFHGLYLELKTPRGKPTAEQRDWLAALKAQGYRAEVARGFQEAINIIENYLHET